MIDIIKDMEFDFNKDERKTSITIYDSSLDNLSNTIKIRCNDRDLYYSIVKFIERKLKVMEWD